MQKELLKLKCKNSKKWLFICAGIFMAAVCFMAENSKNAEITEIIRPDYDEESENVALEVYAEGKDSPFLVELEISPKEYDEEQIETIFEEVYESVLDIMKSENESLSYVTKNLYLPVSSDKYPVAIEWYVDDYGVIDDDGQVYNTEFEPGQTKTAELTMVLSYGKYHCEYIVDVTVYGAEFESEKEKEAGIVSTLTKLEQDLKQDCIELPGTIHGMKVSYQYAKDKQSGIVGLIGLSMVPLLLYLRKKQESVKTMKKRKEQMSYDYAEVISKLVLLAGAGMTIRKAWEKIAADYQKNQHREKRYVYEEMVRTCAEMNTGISERSAYERFAKRCDTKEYLKLASLLSQNVKKGTNDILKLLEEESKEAFELHKNLAKRKGEEAGTKLLFPMIVMLAVVMAMLMFPAIMSFQTF